MKLHRVAELRVLGCRLPAPARLTRLARKLADRADGDLHLLVPVHDRAQHDLFGEALGFGLDHEHCVLGTGHDEVQL